MRTSTASGADAPPRLSPFVQLSFAVHGLSAGALLLAPERWRAAVAAIAANQLAITYGSVWPRSRLLGPNITRLPGPSLAGVGLTFDDGPDPEVTPAVLDVLDRYGSTASFFCIGRKVEAHPEVAALVVARGHRVENHSYSHPNAFAFRGPAGLDAEIGRAQDAIEGATGQRPAYFRAPIGIRSPWLDPCLARAGLALVSWTRRAFDTLRRDPDAVARRLSRGVGPGEILLLHDGSSARTVAGRPVVLEALPRLLDALAERSLRAASVPRPGAPA
jgi:peptidoglycan/xylan/chitin deacetylase (PgdA/CDA1 family)